MATVIDAVELPTGRHSYYNPAPVQDIHDPNWIPVLDGADFPKPGPFTEKEVSPYNTASFSPFPTRAASPKSPAVQPGLTHTYSKSSLAPESVTSELEARPPRSSSYANKRDAPISPTASSAEVQHLRHTSAALSDGQETVTSESADASTAPSTIGTASSLEDQYYALPGQRPESKDAIQPPTVPASTRSSITSIRKIGGVMPPTSKYNRKPVASIAASIRPPTIQSQPQSPTESPRLTPSTPATNFSTPLVQPQASPRIPATESALPAEPTPKLRSNTSTASDRRYRALHSHPSNVSLAQNARSRPNSSSDDADLMPRPPSVRHKPRKSTDSRPTTPRSTLYDSQTPTPAPTTPLPQLPLEATRPSTRDGPATTAIRSPPEAHLASQPMSMVPADHSEMAAFMTTRNTVIFRRFDDVHVRLLLCLQDEISHLEQELIRLEGGGSMPGDRIAQRMRVLRDLRRVVAEYDHLFATWSQMQANKAGRSTMQQLRQWLEKPSTSAEAGLGSGAKEDLDWLEKSKDLSSVTLGPSTTSLHSRSIKTRNGAEGGGDVNKNRDGGNSGGGFAAFFNCAGKRK